MSDGNKTSTALAALWMTFTGADGFLVMPVALGSVVLDLSLNEE